MCIIYIYIFDARAEVLLVHRRNVSNRHSGDMPILQINTKDIDIYIYIYRERERDVHTYIYIYIYVHVYRSE